jgi:hypothetical protein
MHLYETLQMEQHFLSFTSYDDFTLLHNKWHDTKRWCVFVISLLGKGLRYVKLVPVLN